MSYNVSVGIVGFGKVGKSALRVLHMYPTVCDAINGHEIFIWDQRDLTDEEVKLVNSFGAQCTSAREQTLSQFCALHDYLVVSPGVDMRGHAQYHHKILAEIDLFYFLFTPNIIAITGTVGKTSITRLIEQLLLFQNYDAKRIGNSAEPMLTYCTIPETIGPAILEVSSFQLEHVKKFAPDIALWNNVFPNHLDRHATFETYMREKFKIFERQNDPLKHISIIFIDVFEQLPADLQDAFLGLGSNKSIVFPRDTCAHRSRFKNCTVIEKSGDELIFLDYNEDSRRWNKKHSFDLSVCPAVTFEENWIAALCIFYSFANYPGQLEEQLLDEGVCQKLGDALRQEHRLEHVATFRGIDFYNDSKSTVPQATRAAVETLADEKRPLILILGGVDKGVDRTTFFNNMIAHPAVKHVYFFGPGFVGKKNNAYSSLREVLDATLSCAQPGDQILFSPSGASFDVYENFEQRGHDFKQLVHGFCSFLHSKEEAHF